MIVFNKINIFGNYKQKTTFQEGSFFSNSQAHPQETIDFLAYLIYILLLYTFILLPHLF